MYRVIIRVAKYLYWNRPETMVQPKQEGKKTFSVAALVDRVFVLTTFVMKSTQNTTFQELLERVQPMETVTII
jgi:hypothetical protein